LQLVGLGARVEEKPVRPSSVDSDLIHHRPALYYGRRADAPDCGERALHGNTGAIMMRRLRAGAKHGSNRFLDAGAISCKRRKLTNHQTGASGRWPVRRASPPTGDNRQRPSLRSLLASSHWPSWRKRKSGSTSRIRPSSTRAKRAGPSHALHEVREGMCHLRES